MTAELIERTFDARVLRINPGILKGLANVTWKLRFQPTPAGWVEMGTNAPLMDSSRARRVLRWEPQYDARATLLELTEGFRKKAGIDTPPMERKAGGILRNREIRKGVGGANP